MVIGGMTARRREQPCASNISPLVSLNAAKHMAAAWEKSVGWSSEPFTGSRDSVAFAFDMIERARFRKRGTHLQHPSSAFGSLFAQASARHRFCQRFLPDLVAKPIPIHHDLHVRDRLALGHSREQAGRQLRQHRTGQDVIDVAGARVHLVAAGYHCVDHFR